MEATKVNHNIEWTFTGFNASNLHKLNKSRRFCTKYFQLTVNGIKSTWCFDMIYHAGSRRSFSLHLLQKKRDGDDFTVEFEAYIFYNGILLEDSHMQTKVIEAREFDDSTQTHGAEWGFRDWIKLDDLEDEMPLLGGDLVIYIEMILSSPMNILDNLIIDPESPDYIHDEAFSDVTLSCMDGKDFNVHRLVLCKSSKFLQEALAAPDKRNGKGRKIQLAEVHSSTMPEILRFLYEGHVCIRDITMSIRLLKAAIYLKMDALKDVAARDLSHRVSERNVFNIFTIADYYQADELIYRCLQTFRIYFDDLKRQDDWNEMSPMQMLKITEECIRFAKSCDHEYCKI